MKLNLSFKTIMKNFRSKFSAVKLIFLAILALMAFCPTAFSQNYTKKVIELWENGNIPFNKEVISLSETIDSTGRRISQISRPELYVYIKANATENGSALLYCPGGGYRVVSLKNDGESIAKHYLKMNFNVVAVLKYRLPDPRIVNSPEKVPLCDAQKALALLHQNAGNWQIDQNKIAVMGSSAGGHLAASLANLTSDILAPGVKQKELKQAVSILVYPVISPYLHEGSFKRLLLDKFYDQSLLDHYSMEKQVSKNTPPTFLIHANDDRLVIHENSDIYASRLKKHNIVHKYVQLEKGGHGFGLNFSRTGTDWTIDLEEWLHKKTNLFDKQ